MGRKHLIVVITVLLGFFLLAGLSCTAKNFEEIKIEAQVINIDTDKGLSPATVTLKPGTTVIWVNKSFVPQEILFSDKKVVLSCDAPVNFFVGKDGTYESAKIPFGGIASLCFIEKGKYEYELRSSKTFYESYSPVKREFKGSISIQ
jgi:plastocyanin